MMDTVVFNSVQNVINDYLDLKGVTDGKREREREKRIISWSTGLA